MKTILVLTDFSSSAKNAEIYASALAGKFKSKIILFHVFSLPVVSADVPVPVTSLGELEKINLKQLKKEATLLRKKNNLKVEVLTKAGFVVSETLELEKKIKPDLIVVGMKGKTNATRILIGSTVTDLLSKLSTPLLAVPEKKKFHIPEKILLACDYGVPAANNSLSLAKEFAKKFHSEIYVVNVVLNGEEKISSRVKAGIEIEKELKDVNYVYYFPHKKDVIEGIDYFIHRHKTDMIAMVPHKHNLWEKLFRRSNTKRMISRAKIPVLALPDKNKRVPVYLV